MNRIQLDQSKLLGFRIEPVEGNPAKLGAKVGQPKVGDKGGVRFSLSAKTGAKVGGKNNPPPPSSR